MKSRWQILLAGSAFGALAVTGAMPMSAFGRHVLIIGLIYATVAASWDLLIGYAGQLSFGHAALFGVGGYAAAILSGKVGISPWANLFLGGVVAALLGAVFGLPALRVRGPYLALTTLALMSATQVVIQGWNGLTGGQQGYYGYRTLPGIPYSVENYYWVALVYSVLAFSFLYWLGSHTALGLRWQALRDDEMRASALGLNVVWAKLLAFAISAFVAGVAGAIFANYITVVTPDMVSFNLTTILVAMAVIGGRGTIFGALIGGLGLETASQYLRLAGVVYNDIATGALVVLVIWFMPDGVLGTFGRLLRHRSWSPTPTRN